MSPMNYQIQIIETNEIPSSTQQSENVLWTPFICQMYPLVVTKITYRIYHNVPDVTVGPLIITNPLLSINMCGNKLKGEVMCIYI